VLSVRLSLHSLFAVRALAVLWQCAYFVLSMHFALNIFTSSLDKHFLVFCHVFNSICGKFPGGVTGDMMPSPRFCPLRPFLHPDGERVGFLLAELLLLVAAVLPLASYALVFH
jgi:hypothetical protein